LAVSQWPKNHGLLLWILGYAAAPSVRQMNFSTLHCDHPTDSPSSTMMNIAHLVCEEWLRAPGNCLSHQRKGGSVRPMNELVFEVTQESDGGFVAEVLGESIVTQADTWEELRSNVREAVRAFYFDRPAPPRLRLHLVRDEVIA
jgi:hypothetical protein